MKVAANKIILSMVGACLLGVGVYIFCFFRSAPNPVMIYVIGGPFLMGSKEGDADALRHEERVGSFFLGEAEVTVGAFADFLNSTTNGAFHSEQFLEKDGRYTPRLSSRPVAWVNYEDAAQYCAWLSLKLGQRIRLPTEAEWEYAARGGIYGARFPWGWGDPRGLACFNAFHAKRVCSFDPNPWGFYDMAGNVGEWCVTLDMNKPEVAVARGGCWADRDEKFLRVFHRVWFPKDYRDADVGFRILMEPGNVPTNKPAIRQPVGL